MKYLEKISLLAIIPMIASMGPILASGQGGTPPLNTEETKAQPTSQSVKQKKTPEEKVDKAVENVARETGKGVAKVDQEAHKVKDIFKEAYKKQKHKK